MFQPSTVINWKKEVVTEQSKDLNEHEANSQERENNHEDLVQKIIDALEATGAGKIFDKNTTESAQYEIGVALSEAKKRFNGSTKKYGAWCKKYILENSERAVVSKTLKRWSQYCEFGTLEQCQLVGFTNVNMLSAKTYADVRSDIQKKLNDDPDAGSDVYSEMIKKREEEIKAEKAEKAAKESEEDKGLEAKLAEAEVLVAQLQAELKEKLAELPDEVGGTPSEVAEPV